MGDDRPLGIIIMAILYGISGVATIILGILAMTPTVLVLLGMLSGLPAVGPYITMIVGMIQAYLTIIGIVVIIVGVIDLLVVAGLLSMKEWGWTIAVIISIFYIIVIIGIVYLWYLFKDETKSAYGKY